MSNTINETTFNHSHDTATLCLQTDFNQTEAGVIPSDWTAKQLKDVFALKNGYSFKGEFFSNDGPIVLTPGNFKLEGGLYFETRNTKRYCAEYPKGYEFEKGDLVVVMTDLTPDCNLLGKPAFVDFDEKILHNQRIGKITQLLKNWERRFLYYTLLSPAYLSNVKSAATGSTVRHTSPSTIASTWIAEPPILEQTAIANALSDVDALIQELEKLIAKKQAIKTATMQQLLTGRTRLPQFANHPDGRKKGYKSSELGEIPEDWEVVRLGDVGETIIGLTYSPNDVAEYGTLVLRSSNVQQGKLAYSDCVYVNMSLPDRVIVREGDILVCVRNGSRQLIGKCALIDKKAEGHAFGAFMSIYRTQYSKFVFYQFQSDLIQSQINEMMGATINQITNKDMASFLIGLPCDAKEQTAIAQICSDIDEEIQALEQRLNKTCQIKQGMMQELLTGKTRLIKGGAHD